MLAAIFAHHHAVTLIIAGAAFDVGFIHALIF